MAVEQVTTEDGFIPAPSSSEWYKNLDHYGSCLRLLHLLAKQRQLIHQTGPQSFTVLHKGVVHGCVKLVKFILVNMFDDEGNCTCRLHDPGYCSVTREELLRKACAFGSTAVNMAVVSGSPKMVLLLKWAIDKNKELSEKLPQKVEDTYKDDRRIRSGFVKEKGCEVEGEDLQRLFEVCVNQESITLPIPTTACRPQVVKELMESADVTGNVLVVPDVRDDGIDKIYETDRKRESTMILKVYSIIEEILENPGSDLQEQVDILKDRCMKDVDYEFAPIAHVCLHFLSQTFRSEDGSMDILGKIITECKACDDEEGAEGAILRAVFNILDPRGRTILHVAFANNRVLFLRILLEGVESVNSTIVAECLNAKDGAGRSLVHLMCVHDIITDLAISDRMDRWDDTLSPLCRTELEALQEWCFPGLYKGEEKQQAFQEWFSSGPPKLAEARHDYSPIHLAMIFNSMDACSKILSTHACDINVAHYFSHSDRTLHIVRPFHIAAFLGRSRIVENFLEHHLKSHKVKDLGLGTDGPWELPAIHCAVLSSQVEVIQSILKYPSYDPIVQVSHFGTALHLLLARRTFQAYLKHFHTLALLHVLPVSRTYERIKNDFLKCHIDDNEPRMLSANEISCINLLLQAGIDIWTPHSETKELPNPGPTANEEARKWWYDKVVTEVVTLKTNTSYAANATSVIAALVATASFIGPLQPPLGYAGDGYIQTNRSPVRVYLVCNSLSFFFSIASILMAVLPAIPMPKESLYDELLRSQRYLKAAALMLLISIICILISFSSASIAVVSSDWHEKQLLVARIVFGSGITVVVLVIYIIRLLRMLFHKNDRYRRWIANHMYF